MVAVSLFILTAASCSNGSPQVRQPLVVSYHETAQKAGYRILNSGGNAFDAYVTVSVVENVVSSGYVTLAGLLSTLIYRQGTGETVYLDGGFNSVLDPAGAFDPENPVKGKAIVVPGLVAGLEAISKRYGRLSFAEVLQPAIEIAGDGFVVDERFASHIAANAKKIQRTAYGRRTFFPDGTALKAGDILKQPELAEFLTKLAKQGAAYMYRGEWAAKCVETARKGGGLMTMEDMAAYKPTWTRPWRMSYRGYDIHASSGRSMFALWALLALKTLEHTNLQTPGHYAASADALEIVVRVARAVDREPWIRKYRSLDDRELVNSRLTKKYTAAIWAKVKGALNTGDQKAPPSHHTLSTIIADREGNVVSGKHSINSDWWGQGLFIQGVLLNGSGDMPGRYTGPGQRRTQGAPNFLVFKDGALRYACGTFSSSNPHAAFQFLVNLLDYKIPADRAVALPRFGSVPYDEKDWSVDFSKNWLDERVSREIVDTLKARGVPFSQKRPRLGKGCIAEFHPDGSATTGYDKIN